MPSTSIYGSFMAPKKLSSGTDNRAKALPGASAMNFPPLSNTYGSAMLPPLSQNDSYLVNLLRTNPERLGILAELFT